MRVARWLAVAACPGFIVLALNVMGVRVASGWYHIVGLVGLWSIWVTMGVSLPVWLADKLRKSAQTRRLRWIMTAACVLSMGLLWTAASIAYADGVHDAEVFFIGWLILSLTVATVLRPPTKHAQSLRSDP